MRICVFVSITDSETYNLPLYILSYWDACGVRQIFLKSAYWKHRLFRFQPTIRVSAFRVRKLYFSGQRISFIRLNRWLKSAYWKHRLFRFQPTIGFRHFGLGNCTAPAIRPAVQFYLIKSLA